MLSSRENKTRGFMLIELLIVLALLGSLTALAAQNFAWQFDNKDQTDSVQMDYLLHAFQLQQPPLSGNHNSPYDMLNSDTTPEKALNDFLKDALSNPSSSVYMPNIKRERTDETPTADNPIFKATVSSTQIWIVCEDPHNESNARLAIPRTGSIDYNYSDENMLLGTWLVIGDDDRLRDDYFKDLTYHVRAEDELADESQKPMNLVDYQSFSDESKDNNEYRYRTTFMINSGIKTSSTSTSDCFDESWIYWSPQTDKDVEFADIRKGDSMPSEYKLSYRIGKEGNDYVPISPDTPFIPLTTETTTSIQFANDSSMSGQITDIQFKIEREGFEPLYRLYRLQTLHFTKIDPSLQSAITADLIEELNAGDEIYGYTLNGGADSYLWCVPTLTSSGDKDGIEYKDGEISGNPHLFHFWYDGEDPEESTAPDYDIIAFDGYHAGFIFNINHELAGDYQTYDSLLFEVENDKMVLRSYEVTNGSAEPKTTINLNEFSFGRPYTMDLIVKNGKIHVSLSDELLPSSYEEFVVSSRLEPVIGYYLGEDPVLNGRKALAIDGDSIPLISIKDKYEDPQFILLQVPEITLP